MPALTATYSTQVSNSTREDLSDVIANPDPTEAPIQANIAVTQIDNPDGYESQIDSLNTVDAGGVVDGFDFSALGDSVTTRSKILFRCQIQAKGIKISNRQERVDKAGLTSEIAYQLANRAESLHRDCESAITTMRTPVPSASGTAPLCAGIPTWLRTHSSFGATGAAPTLSGSEPVQPSGSGTARALDESIWLGQLGDVWDDGGNIDMCVVSTPVKQLMSRYFFTSSARIATQYQDQGRSPDSGLQVVGAVDFYVSDFGVIAIVPDRFLNRNSDAMMLDTSMIELGVFRGYEVLEMGLDGDHERYALVHDFTVIVRDEKTCAIFSAIDTAADMVA